MASLVSGDVCNDEASLSTLTNVDWSDKRFHLWASTAQFRQRNISIGFGITSQIGEYKSVYLSPEHSLGSGGSQSEMNKTFASNLKEAIKFEKSRLEESHAYDLQRLGAQLQDAESLARQSQNCTTQMEMERDGEKKERIEANVLHRKEVEALRRNDDEHAATEAELESLRKEVEVSERSYQELSKAIDDEKERMANAHDVDVRTLQREVEECRDELRQAGAIKNNRLSEELNQKRRDIASYRDRSQVSSEEIMALQSKNRTLQSEKEAMAREVAALKSKNGQLQTQIQRVSSELSTAKAHVAKNINNNAAALHPIMARYRYSHQ